jgi:hypothetical protein
MTMGMHRYRHEVINEDVKIDDEKRVRALCRKFEERAKVRVVQRARIVALHVRRAETRT